MCMFPLSKLAFLNTGVSITLKDKRAKKEIETNFKYDGGINEYVNFLNQNNIKLTKLSHLFVNQGPGNFSGIRTSISVAKGLSITNKLNLYGFSSKDLKNANYMNVFFLYEKGFLTKNLIKPVYIS